MRRYKLLLFVGASLLLSVPMVVFSQGSTEQISRFESRITVSKSNVASIHETILYDFGSSSRHGIYRYVPLVTQAGDSGKNYYYSFKFLSATIDGSHVETSLSKNGVNEVLRLGNPERTITGQHQYELSYQMLPVVEQTAEGDFFNWNLTGNNWEVPIEIANVSISFVPETKIINSRCYSGITGATTQAYTVAKRDNSATFQSQQIIQPGSGLTANILLPANSFSNYLVPSDPPPPNLWPLLGFAIGLLAVLVGLGWRLVAWAQDWRQRRSMTIIPQYESPDSLSPGEIGLLNDNRTDMSEITATLIDLAVRGYLKVEQTKAKSLFGKAKYKFYKLKDPDTGLKDFERGLFNLLFATGSEVALADIKPTTAVSVIATVKQQLLSSLKAKGYYREAPKPKPRIVSWLGGLRLTIFALIIGSQFVAFTNAGSTGPVIFSTIAAAAGIIVAWLLIHRARLSKLGYDQWAEVQGFKLFLSVTEKERLAFHDAPAKNPQQFSELLPYAIALGVEKQWAKQFEGMDVSQEIGWYSGVGPFTPYILASSLGSDFSPAISSSVTPTQSSSGFSGGGFSGGGGGGGGGGSW